MTRPATAVLSALSASALLGFVACGGGGGDDGPAVLQLSLPALAALDGQTRSDGPTASGVLGSAVGDIDNLGNGIVFRSHFSFDLTPLPAGATIVSAVMTLSRIGSDGDPTTGHGDLVVDHVDTGGTLDIGDHVGGTITQDVARFLPTSFTPNVDVTAPVVIDYAGARPRTEFRVRFATESDTDGAVDDVVYNNAENLPQPRLVVSYTLP